MIDEQMTGGLGTITVSTTPKEKFREFLSTQGKRLTRERETIIDEVYSSHEHFIPDEIVDRLAHRKDSKRVSRSTIYRTVAQLEEAGLLRKVARKDDSYVYEHDYGYPQHDHLICSQCGELEEFTNNDISELLKEVAEKHNFLMDGHRLEVHGVCSNCRRTSKTRRHAKLDMI